MTARTDASTPTDTDSGLLIDLMSRAERLFVKKLSANDRRWAQQPNIHQGGVYVPPVHRDSGFFPPLTSKERSTPEAADIREVMISTFWPQTGAERESRLVHYTSKGAETHLTRVPKEAFQELLPASLLVIGRTRDKGKTVYVCLTIQSGSEDDTVLSDTLGLKGDFHFAEFDPVEVKRIESDLLLVFAEELLSAWRRAEIGAFAKLHATMPTTTALAEMARSEFLRRNGIATLNPFELTHPGDALREISRNIEWEIFRAFQRKDRAIALVRLILGDEARETTSAFVLRRLVEMLPGIDALMLSAAQQRKSRAGYSYEHQIEAMFVAGKIPFEKQVVIDAQKRPDFVLPSLKRLKEGAKGKGLILSLKTTLRERWKQVQREQALGELFLATLDENIASNAIEDMAAMKICLVVPETLKNSDETEYSSKPNVLGFRDFLSDVVKVRMPDWQ